MAPSFRSSVQNLEEDAHQAGANSRASCSRSPSITNLEAVYGQATGQREVAYRCCFRRSSTRGLAPSAFVGAANARARLDKGGKWGCAKWRRDLEQVGTLLAVGCSNGVVAGGDRYYNLASFLAGHGPEAHAILETTATVTSVWLPVRQRLLGMLADRCERLSKTVVGRGRFTSLLQSSVSFHSQARDRWSDTEVRVGCSLGRLARIESAGPGVLRLR